MPARSRFRDRRPLGRREDAGLGELGSNQFRDCQHRGVVVGHLWVLWRQETYARRC